MLTVAPSVSNLTIVAYWLFKAGSLIRKTLKINYKQQSDCAARKFTIFFSAGVGRTGVFLAIDTILTKLEKGVINSIDVFGQVCEMRERRMKMVQTLVRVSCLIFSFYQFMF